MQSKSFKAICFLTAILLINVSCKKNPTNDNPDLEESLEPVEEVSVVEGGDDITITVNKDSTAFFRVAFNEIGSNDIIQNGIKKAWCIDWDTYIKSDNGVYHGIKLYSTYLVKKWMPVNYLLNIQKNLQENDPEITYLEIQLAIWSLRVNPPFDLEEVDLSNLPSRFKKNGQPTFNAEKVTEILDKVGNGYQDFKFTSGTKFAVIAETPVDVQTIFGVVEKRE
jgi:hypothetical protein